MKAICKREGCGEVFFPTKRRRLFCSRQCFLLHCAVWRHERKLCPVCRSYFIPRKRDTGTTWRKKKYCSLKCGRKAPPWGLKPLPEEERNEPILTQDEKKPVVQPKEQEK